jgi:hypothetical protein
MVLASSIIEFSNWREMRLFADEGVGTARDDAGDGFARAE